ncbi:MAG TPA: SAM-dependent methyltransferase [Pseudonocardiaceae bacterium]|nr:SAM-dependent methyltransferase [Pseudonocardiaceae bacterium]
MNAQTLTVARAKSVDIDLDHPGIARVYDFYLGGNRHWAIDRQFGKRALAILPRLREISIANRLCGHRVVRHLVGLGVRQFVDIGAGLPTMGSTHQIADESTADSRVVYVDHEPVAVAHTQLMLDERGDPDRHAVCNADLRRPDDLWDRVADTGVIDLDQPVAVLMLAVLHVRQPGRDGMTISTDIGAKSVRRCRELMPSGSHLAISHATDTGVPDVLAEQLVELKDLYDNHSSPVRWRTHTEIRELFGDFEMLQPGMTWTPTWHREHTDPTRAVPEFGSPNESAVLVGVARKP